MPRSWMLPTHDDIKKLSATGDPFKYAVVGFSAIEQALENLISGSMVASHHVELRRMSVRLKIDLAIALGLLPLDSKGLLLKLSKLRNFYAHEFRPNTEYCSAADLKSCFGKQQRAFAGEYLDAARDFNETLRVAFIAAYYELLSRVERVEAKKKEREELMLHIEALLAATGKSHGDWEGSEDYHEAARRLDEEIEAKKSELRRKREGERPGKERARRVSGS